MWHKNINLFFIIFIFWLATVKGSCLEYGHSCWGAHGKRSGAKVFRSGTDITNAELALLPDGSNENHDTGGDATAHGKSFYETLQDAEENNAMQQTLGGRNNEEEIITPSNKQIQKATKLRNLLRKRHSELIARKSLLDAPAESAELPELSNNRLNNQAAAATANMERWRRIPPILQLKSFSNSVDANERGRERQEARKKFLSRTTDEGSSYFDYI